MPVIETLDDLSNASHLSVGLLYKMCKLPELFYRVYSIPKKSGKPRTISQPGRQLKAVQAWILRHILDHLKVSPACKGFERGQSTLDNAMPHYRANAVLTLDVEDFFPSVTVNKVFGVFRTIGFNPRIAGHLAALCTFRGGLPQGAPSSPKLANLACCRMDARLMGYVSKRSIIYTRYADDLTFSAADVSLLLKSRWAIKKILNSEGFALNDSKTRIAGASRQRRVTGLVLSESGVGIGRKQMRLIRARMHQLSTTIAGGLGGVSTEARHISGWLAYIGSVDKPRFEMLSAYRTKLTQQTRVDDCARSDSSILGLIPSAGDESERN